MRVLASAVPASLLILVTLCSENANATPKDGEARHPFVRAVERIIPNAYEAARGVRTQDKDLALACSKVGECAGECAATLEWIARPDRIMVVERDGLTYLVQASQPSGTRPRVCSEFLRVVGWDANQARDEKKGETWAAERFDDYARALGSTLDAEDREDLDCALARTGRAPSAASACSRSDARAMARLLHTAAQSERDIADSMLATLCGGLAACARDCRAMLATFAFGSDRAPNPSGCRAAPGRLPRESWKKWRERARPWLVQHVSDSLAPFRDSLDAETRAQLDCDAALVLRGTVPTGCRGN
jgi:hypothetical protein